MPLTIRLLGGADHGNSGRWLAGVIWVHLPPRMLTGLSPVKTAGDLPILPGHLCSALRYPHSRPPRSSLHRTRRTKKLSHRYAEHGGNLHEGPDGQILPASFDTLEILQRETEALCLLLLGEPGLGTQLGHTSSDVLDCVVDVVRAHTSDAVTRRACITPTLRLVLSRGMRRAGATGLFSSHRPGNMEDKERSHVHQIP